MALKNETISFVDQIFIRILFLFFDHSSFRMPQIGFGRIFYELVLRIKTLSQNWILSFHFFGILL